MALAFLAPATIDGLAYLAPAMVPEIVIPPAPEVTSASVGGGRARRSGASSSKSSSHDAPSRYHGNAYEQAQAAELDDEETILAFLMEIACHGIL